MLLLSVARKMMARSLIKDRYETVYRINNSLQVSGSEVAIWRKDISVKKEMSSISSVKTRLYQHLCDGSALRSIDGIKYWSDIPCPSE